MPQSVYVHIPFCKTKCRYCSFVSYEGGKNITDYIKALVKEIESNYRGEALNTLYIGGGTPSLLPAEFLREIAEKFNCNQNAELTVEINPDDALTDYLRELRGAGFNRLSFGAQSFDDKILKIIGRRHNSSQIETAIKSAKQAGFENISLDLIYGLPEQTKESLREDLNKFFELEIPHISTYGLKIEPESYWGKHTAPIVPDDDTQADMFDFINDELEQNGFYRYEISNFSKKGYESKHNLNYWNNGEYYGFGVSAHGYIEGVRYSNTESVEEYISNPACRKSETHLSEREKLEEEIFLGFRKTAGIDTEKIRKIYNIDFEKKYGKILDKYSEYIVKTESGYALNYKGAMLSTVILSEFL